MSAPAGRRPEEDLCHAIESYYTQRLAKYGATPLGVDWSCLATQCLRFVKLLLICDFSAPFSINDLGCGYGALFGFIRERHPGARFDYTGIDLSAAMIARARRRHRGSPGQRFRIGRKSPQIADYTLASGIMNVKLGHSRAVWETHVAEVLREMRATSRRGFAVNFMSETGAVTEEGLYRTTADTWRRFCESKLGCRAEAVEGYGMREFTLLAYCGPGDA